MNSKEQLEINLKLLENSMRIATRINNNHDTGRLYNPGSTINLEEVKRIYKELKNLINE